MNKEQQDKNKKIGIISGIIIFISIAIVLWIVFGGSFGDSPSSSTPSKSYYMGETVSSNKASIIVSRVEDTKMLGTEILGDKTSYNFLIVTVNIRNRSNKELSLSSSSFAVELNGAKYETHTGGIYITDGFYALENIGSGMSKTLKIVFETPTTSASGNYIFKFRPSILDSYMSVNLRSRQ